jgi:glycosyltransferase involved in cell wall biosynthesis
VRIAQVAPLFESTPPRLYGGAERVVSYLTEELVLQGHQLTLFASGDSITAAELIAPCQRALRLNPDCRDPLAYHIIMPDEVFRRADYFDIIHFHVDYLHFPISTRMRIAHLTTLRAYALLFPIDWPEPFGLVMIEALACGTPVIAFRNGSVPEIIEDGTTGFVVASVEQAVDAVRRVASLRRTDCRRSFEKRFTASRMAGNYVAEYAHLAAPHYETVVIETP